MDCKEILALVAKGFRRATRSRSGRRSPARFSIPRRSSLYTHPDFPAKLRHLAARFTLELAVDAGSGLRKMKRADLDQAWWNKLGQRVAGGPREDWSQHVDGE